MNKKLWELYQELSEENKKKLLEQLDYIVNKNDLVEIKKDR